MQFFRSKAGGIIAQSSGRPMKRPTRSTDLARKRALIRSLIEQSPLGSEAQTPTPQRHDLAGNVEYLWDAQEAAHLPIPPARVPANIIPFPDLRGKPGR